VSSESQEICYNKRKITSLLVTGAEVRLVSLLASATEMIAALGCIDQLVARSHECDYPEAVLSLPVVSRVQIDTGASSAHIDAQIKQLAQSTPEPHDAAIKALSIYAINVALLQELRPDVIFTQAQCEVCAVSERDVTRAVEQLTGLQPRIVSLAPYRLDDVWEDITRVGAALDRREQAERLVTDYQQRLTRLRELTMHDRERPRVAVLEWLDPLMGAGNWTPELVDIAGGVNVFGEMGQHAPWLTWEELQAADPDVLVLAPCGFTLERTMQDVPLLQQHPFWRSLRAVRDGRVYAIDGNAYINRSGPRLVESSEILGRVLWGGLPGINVDEQAWMHVG
jgi:iron complex transport system substrate-binding protein